MLVPVPGVPGLYVRSAMMGTDEAAEVLSIPATTLARMAADDVDFPCTRLGKHLRFSPGHIGEIVLAGERRSKATVPTLPPTGSATRNGRLTVGEQPNPRRSTARTKL
ncbi:hypothetical protein [Cellulomonas fimi]|uniref:hypothetical protein n=1 Tax=Cellulomonas fimi TaxID=1708 RepID=UPI00235974EE|nr:hypothetical protein [Cellulomonas fimi]